MEVKNETNELVKLENGKHPNWGGKRNGGGRKPKNQEEILTPKFTARELFYKKVDERWDLLMEALDECLFNKDKDILKFVIEQRIGKASQAVNVDIQANIKVEHLESNLQNLLYGRELNKDTEDSESFFQDGRREANVIDGIAVQDISTDSTEAREESLVECPHEIREITNSSSCRSDES